MAELYQELAHAFAFLIELVAVVAIQHEEVALVLLL